ncbi:hypothetical protein DUNSADRAFT_9759 [Dunaliella salina]|uniref:non-specific serine/threonine protein kinase n=1 Tax=Dunaliella salina TaxID=3046 RepID=A0ABQ7GGS5_DUNSA|nr:hypothetical protein DUNSADRAFT_9759 [Dunaliella salina]|eukprot:KAF5833812.1 hypothetical protein DUNSADRAFT_9759 [Dunaliella salina]
MINVKQAHEHALLYDVGKAVGKGGYAVVYRGVRREDGRVIAVKKVEIFEMSPKKRDRCIQEVTLLAQLKHPYIIQMLDAFIDENMLIIIFEWAPAGDLKRLIKKTAEAQRTLDEPAIWSLFAQICNGLRYMHQHRIMHRDIKPANVLVGANGALKLGDLGLGRQLSEQTMEAFSKMEGANLYDVFQKISKGNYEPLPADQFSPTLRKLVTGMLHVDPAGRPELEEVWAVTSSVIESQARSQQDVFAAAEMIHCRLLLIEAECAMDRGAEATNAPVDGKTGRRTSSRSAKEGGKPPTGRSAESASKKGASSLGQSAPPPRGALRLLHPAYFACPLGAMPAFPPFLGLTSEGEQAKQQLGTFLTVFAWLLRVGGWIDLAPAVDTHTHQIPLPGPRPAPRPRSRELAARPHSREANGTVDANGGGPRQPRPGSQEAANGSDGGAGGRGSRPHSREAAQNGGAVDGGLVPVPPPPRQSPTPPASLPASLPVCSNLLKGAEAAKTSAQKAGVATDFIPVAARVPIAPRPPIYRDPADATVAAAAAAKSSPAESRAGSRGSSGPESRTSSASKGSRSGARPANGRKDSAAPPPGGEKGGITGAAEEREDVIEDVGDGEGEEEEHAVLTLASPMPPAYLQSDQDEEGEWGGGGGSVGLDHWEQRLRPPLHEGGASSSSSVSSSRGPEARQRQSRHRNGRLQQQQQQQQQGLQQQEFAGVQGGPNQLQGGGLLVAQRLAPALSRIHIQGSDLSTGVGAWALKWQTDRKVLLELISSTPPLISSLEGIAQGLAHDLDRLKTRESHINNEPHTASELHRLAQLRSVLERLQQQVTEREHRIQSANAELARLHGRLASIQEEMSLHTDNLDGSRQLGQMRNAVRDVSLELHGMDARIGLLQQQLINKQRRRLQLSHHLPPD